MKEKIEADGFKPCRRCGKDIQLENWSEHLRMCDEKLPCQFCGKTFFKHILAQHSRQCQMPKPKCEICGKEYTDKNYHMKTHQKKKKCVVCGLEFHNLERHMKVHTEEPKECPECGKKVRFLELHMRTMHIPDSQKKVVCSECGKGFVDKNHLDKHMMSVHLKLRPYRCRYGCDIGYNDSSNRNCHERKKHGGIFKG